MPDRNSPGPLSDPSDFSPGEIEEAFKDGGLAFRRRTREFFTDGSSTPPATDAKNPVAESPFTTKVSGVQRDAVERVHDNRSPAAQRADEAFNAPTTTDTSKWASAPNEFDYPGVDTVSDRNQRRRAEELTEFAESKGVVDEVSVEDDITLDSEGVGNPMGLASTDEFGTSSSVQLRDDVKAGDVDDPRFDFGPVLSHEVGHAIDFGAGLTFSEFLEKDENGDLREQAETVSKTMRGEFEDASDDRIDYRSGKGEGSRELVADFVASRTLQPRATERIAPELTEEFDQEFEQEFDTDPDRIF